MGLDVDVGTWAATAVDGAAHLVVYFGGAMH